ncbi:uncharacterized protein LOC127655912 isoform X3 [Xyrauchen texanus]|uniref:uncharacterized protein LOC127655912 isoform X3 n=1 Tax=Xyrauchen texanus TaxID=154827 RepID=UPI0022422ADB|nr:uncharacterized protein LOC127655912 isoform X3 [Xyrauchen texanus]
MENASTTRITHYTDVGDADGSAEVPETTGDRRRGEAPRPVLQAMESIMPAASPGLTRLSPGLPKWNQVVKRGRQKRTEESQQGVRIGKSVLERRAAKIVVGTGAARDIKMITTKRDEGKEGASGHPPAAEQPLDQTDRAGAELKQPPSKKTALEDLLGGTFDEPVAQHFSQIDAEMNKCRAETSISLNSCAALQSLSSVRIVVSKTYYSAIKNMSFVWSSALGKDVCNVHINHI